MIGEFEYLTAEIGKWQLFDGVNWRQAFDTLELAEKFGRRFGAKRIGLVTADGEYSPQMELE